MNSETAQKILALNHQFYQSFAEEFSETRGRLQPGVLKLLGNFPPGIKILDLGCGNGELARQLTRSNFTGTYLGTDFSSNLLEEAVRKVPDQVQVSFTRLDLTEPDWNMVLPREVFDLVLCFAALHHIPSHPGRLSVCNNIRKLISETGQIQISNWQFLKSERLKKRIIPWEEAGLTQDDVDQGDYLLDWRRGGYGLRYIHHFNPEELSRLADESGFRIIESFDSDGKSGNLSLYQVWEPV
jgi:2-polyprenyl-3-methyl-5-hydroxy-6-metoxy-1,4-benzoquinol methylase